MVSVAFYSEVLTTSPSVKWNIRYVPSTKLSVFAKQQKTTHLWKHHCHGRRSRGGMPELRTFRRWPRDSGLHGGLPASRPTALSPSSSLHGAPRLLTVSLPLSPPHVHPDSCQNHGYHALSCLPWTRVRSPPGEDDCTPGLVCHSPAVSIPPGAFPYELSP